MTTRTKYEDCEKFEIYFAKIEKRFNFKIFKSFDECITIGTGTSRIEAFKFNNKDGLMTIEEIYSLGPSISILMDGYIQKDDLVSLRGTLVPATTVNKVIGSIPVIGDLLVGKKAGEGVFGVSFKIKGYPDDLKTTVNPIKTLTPRFITRTLEKIKKSIQ